jgi:predicted RecB family nuclease
MRKQSGTVIYSPSDLIRFLASPYSSWMDRCLLERPDALVPDEDTEDRKLIARSGDEHERAILEQFKASTPGLVPIPTTDFETARAATLAAIQARAPIVYQAALSDDRFAGFADFLVLGEDGRYRVWDTKLARSPKPYYAIQLCCYSEMLAAATGEPLPDRFGIILGSSERVEFRVEDFLHYYRRLRQSFLAMQDGFTGSVADCPEPLPAADHGCWTTHAETFFEEQDHLVRVAGITVGQIKKLKAAGVTTMTGLAGASNARVPKLAADTLAKLVAQARLQTETLADRARNPEAPARYELISNAAAYGPVGLSALPPVNPGDVFFDMEGYPLVPGGLEYLFGACAMDEKTGRLAFFDWWAHDRDEEKQAFEAFVDWVFARWGAYPGMHIYHYAAYEVSAIRRLSTRHNTRQDEVDQLLRNEVFVDLYQILRHGLRIGEPDYSIKTVERLYRLERSTAVATAADSMVQYAGWMSARQSPNWSESPILKAIRDYNEDDCRSTAGLAGWLRGLAAHGGDRAGGPPHGAPPAEPRPAKELPPEAVRRQEVARALAALPDDTSQRLAELVDFHRREEKPMWWRMFDRADATDEDLRDDSGCIQGVQAVGAPTTEKQSLIQAYRFDPAQECKLAAGDLSKVMFTYDLNTKFGLVELDLSHGTLSLKIGRKTLAEKFGDRFPADGSLLPDEYVPAAVIQAALTDVADGHLAGALHAPAGALFARTPPSATLQGSEEETTAAAIRVCLAMSGGCLVIQGPPGTGKTYTGAHVIKALLDAGNTVGVASNSHKAVVNLMEECGKSMRKSGQALSGIKVGSDSDGPLFSDNPGLRHIEATKDAHDAFSGGIIGGTAWLFTRPEWSGALDYLFVDEAGQVSLANVVAMARCARNLIMLGDQMQLEQPVQGTHPGDAGLSGLQYALKDVASSKTDQPAFHAVVPGAYGLFLGESRRMHPSVCRFISEAIYEGRLGSHTDCARQRVEIAAGSGGHVLKEHGIVLSAVEHDGNIQQSDEEVARVMAIFHELVGRPYTASDGTTKPLSLNDFLFIAPYNAQVRALQAALPSGARVGSVDKFQGQQAPVCILSLCSSYGEYGSRGLGFILDRNRVNVAISRAQCLAVVVADPRIANGPVSTLEEMALVNLFCKILAQ